MSDELIELPEGWEWSVASEVCASVRDGTHDTPTYYEQGIPLVTSKNLKGSEIDFSTARLISFEDHKQISVRSGVDEGDILFAMIGTIGNPIVVAKDRDFSIKNIGLFKKNPNTVDSHYLRFWFLSSTFYDLLDKEALIKGTTQKFVPLANLRIFPIPLAPIAEQKRIVAKIEELRSRTQKAREALEAIPKMCDRFRQSVLAAAFRGDLTTDWREENSDVEWKKTTLGEIIKGKPRNGYSPKPVEYPTKVKSLTLSATTSGVFKPEHSKYIDEEIDPASHLWLTPGDILIQRSNTLDYVGTSAIYDGAFGEFIYPDLMMKIQIQESKTVPKFIQYVLSSQGIRKYFKDNATGTAGNMPKINQQTVMNTPLLLPVITEQKLIIDQIDQAFQAIDRIHQQYEQAKARLEKLDRSILAQAFRGELVPQDPNDEPASVLLDQIREERAKMSDRKPSTRKR